MSGGALDEEVLLRRNSRRSSSLKAIQRIREIANGIERTEEDDLGSQNLPDHLEELEHNPMKKMKESIEINGLESESEDIDDHVEEPFKNGEKSRRGPNKADTRKRTQRPRVKCDVCLKTFDMYHLKLHKATKHGNKPIGTLLTGLKKGCDDNPYKCPLENCNARLKTPQFLKRHFLLHLETNPFTCPIPGCGVKCDAQSHLNRHMRQHTGELQVKCPTCGIPLSRKDKLITHKCKEFKNSGAQSYINRYAHLRLQRISKIKPAKVDIPKVESRRGLAVDLNTIFLADPVFIKVCKVNPEFKDLMIGLDHKEKEHGKGRQASRKRRSTRKKPKDCSNDDNKDEIKVDTETTLGQGPSSNIATTYVKVEHELIIEADRDNDAINIQTDQCIHDIVIKTEVDIP